MEKKITQKELYAQIIEFLTEKGGSDEHIEFLQSRIALLDKKAETKKSKGASAETIALTERVYSVLVSAGKGMTVSEVQKSDTELYDLSTPKVTSLMRVLIEQGKVVRTAVGKRVEFSAVV